MPRHLMVRRQNDSDRSHSRPLADQNWTSNIMDADSGDQYKDKLSVLRISKVPLSNTASRDFNMDKEMSWESLHEDINDHRIDAVTFRIKNERLDTKYEGYPHREVPNIDKPELTSSELNLNKISRKLEKSPQSGKKDTTDNLKICNPGMSNSYRLLGVKKNFLQRSENLGISRLHALSPSKTRQSPLKSLHGNPFPGQGKQSVPKDVQPKPIPTFKYVSTNETDNLSLTPLVSFTSGTNETDKISSTLSVSFTSGTNETNKISSTTAVSFTSATETTSPGKRKYLTPQRKQPYLRIQPAGSQEAVLLTSSNADPYTSVVVDNHLEVMDTAIEEAVQTKQVIKPATTQGMLQYNRKDLSEASYTGGNPARRVKTIFKVKGNIVSSELSPSKTPTMENNTQMKLGDQLSQNCVIDLTKVKKDSNTPFFHDDKENSPPIVRHRPGQSSFRNKNILARTSYSGGISTNGSNLTSPSRSGSLSYAQVPASERNQSAKIPSRASPHLDDNQITSSVTSNNQTWRVEYDVKSNNDDRGPAVAKDLKNDKTYKLQPQSKQTAMLPMRSSAFLSAVSMNPVFIHENTTNYQDTANKEDSDTRTATPFLDQEINNPDELPASVEIDVVGDLPPTHTTSSSMDSGIVSDLSTSVNEATRRLNYPEVKEECVAHDLSAHGARLSRSPESSFLRSSNDSHSTPERHYTSKPMFSSTPVSHIWSPWIQPQQINNLPFQQPTFYPYMSSFQGPAAFTILPSPTIMAQQVQVVNAAQYQGINGVVYRPSIQSRVDLNRLGNGQYSNTSISSPLHLDLPLNLTNRRSVQPSPTDTQTPQGSVYPGFSISTRRLFSGDTNSPIPDSLYGNLLPSQHQLAIKDKSCFPESKFALPVLSIPQEYPLNMSITHSRQDTNVEDGDNLSGPSDYKKRRLSRKYKRCEKPLQIVEHTSAQNRQIIKREADTSSSAILRSLQDQPIKGVILGSPPPGARPISFLVKTKERMDGADRKMPKAGKRSKENVCDGESESAKQRNKPELFGDKDIAELQVTFYECPERARFCDGNLTFQVPKIPDSAESQSELRMALLRLFSNSNLPPVPSALQHSVHALSQYPFMQHIFSLQAQGVNLDILKFGAYGLAFENIRLVELGDQKFNDLLDRMSYLGEDDLLHCLVKNEKTGALCGHVAHEIGKIRRHSKNHYPDKKWVCVFCRVQMCDMTDLERHTATHTELKPFECPQCSKKFCQKVTLTQHMHKGHGQELLKWDAKSSYICRQDGCSFSQGEEMACIRHLKQHHAQTDYIKRKNQNKWPFNCLSQDIIKLVEEET